MSTPLEFLQSLDPVAQAALPRLLKSLRLGSVDDYDDATTQVVEMSVGAVADMLVQDAAELGAATARGTFDPSKLQLIRNRYAALDRSLQQTMARTPQVTSILGPLAKVMQASRGIIGASANAALQLRTQAQFRQLRRPNNQTTIHIKNLADGDSSATYTIRAPVAGRPFRFMKLKSEVATVGSDTVSPSRSPVGVGFSSFNILGQERVKVENVDISTGTLETAKWDLTDFSRQNQDQEPEQQINPWGIGPSGWFEAEFTFKFVIKNDCGRAVNASITFYWQASPCDDDTNGRGIYRGPGVVPIQSNRTAKLFRNVMAYTPHALQVSGYEDEVED